MTKLTLPAIERSTYVVHCAFTDEDGVAVVPDTITWTLTDNIGTVINSRLDVAVAVPAAAIDIVLSGLDLVVSGSTIGRVLTVSSVYTSTLGTLPCIEACSFGISDLVSL
jgi:hypothetical protein